VAIIFTKKIAYFQVSKMNKADGSLRIFNGTVCQSLLEIVLFHGTNGFITVTKLGTTNTFLLLQPKILLQQPNALLIDLNISLL